MAGAQADPEIAKAFREIWIRPRRAEARKLFERYIENGVLDSRLDPDLGGGVGFRAARITGLLICLGRDHARISRQVGGYGVARLSDSTLTWVTDMNYRLHFAGNSLSVTGFTRVVSCMLDARYP